MSYYSDKKKEMYMFKNFTYAKRECMTQILRKNTLEKCKYSNVTVMAQLKQLYVSFTLKYK